MGGILYYELRDPMRSATCSAGGHDGAAAKTTLRSRSGRVPSGNAAKSLGTTSAQLDPTLRMEAMLVTESLVYSGTGRNIFSASSAAGGDSETDCCRAAEARCLPPPPPPPQGPPPPPPIDLKFFGTATRPGGKRQAFLLHGDDVYLASDGDIVQRQYRVISVAANSILVEDMANNNRQTLPLLAQ